MFKKCIIGIAVVLLIAMKPAAAHSEVSETNNEASSEAGANSSDEQASTSATGDAESRFAAFKPNFAMVANSENDEPGLQVRLSAKYTFLDCSKGSNNGASAFLCNPLGLAKLDNLNVFFSYTTDFDFYIFSDGNGELERESQPVRNRLTSPGLHFNWSRKLPDNRSGFWWRGATAAIVHQSNGQDVEYETFFDDTTTDQQIAQTIASLDENRPSWMDSVSRGWNFLEFEGEFLLGNNFSQCSHRISCVNVSASVKIPISDIDDEIWWEPGNDSRYRDYNIVGLRIADAWGRVGRSNSRWLEVGSKEFSLEFSCGDAGCSTNTWLRLDTYFGRGNFRLPLMFFAHLGPNEHFYNYHEDTDTFGIGFQFNP